MTKLGVARWKKDTEYDLLFISLFMIAAPDGVSSFLKKIEEVHSSKGAKEGKEP